MTLRTINNVYDEHVRIPEGIGRKARTIMVRPSLHQLMY